MFRHFGIRHVYMLARNNGTIATSIGNASTSDDTGSPSEWCATLVTALHYAGELAMYCFVLGAFAMLLVMIYMCTRQGSYRENSSHDRDNTEETSEVTRVSSVDMKDVLDELNEASPLPLAKSIASTTANDSVSLSVLTGDSDPEGVYVISDHKLDTQVHMCSSPPPCYEHIDVPLEASPPSQPPTQAHATCTAVSQTDAKVVKDNDTAGPAGDEAADCRLTQHTDRSTDNTAMAAGYTCRIESKSSPESVNDGSDKAIHGSDETVLNQEPSDDRDTTVLTITKESGTSTC